MLIKECAQMELVIYLTHTHTHTHTHVQLFFKSILMV